MRNLKRTLSLILALTMLLGMVTTGVSAAETTAAEAPAAVTVGAFKDADQITYTEEVSIMAGMGLFAGTTDGTFDPLGTVTRAQMVTVLVKALRGNEFNANAFKGAGVNPFSDTAVFEGGWAEGYITAGHQMGIVGGYGDGTFKPGKAVTTAEALTMIINALKVDAGEGEWPSTIMAKAEEMKLYGELKTKPATNDPMNREQLAVVTYEGMCYSPKGVSGYRVADPSVDIVFTDIADAIKVNGGVSGITEVVGEDALANQIYELKIAKGFVTANQSTGHEQTTIRPVQDDGTLGDEVDYFVQTDLDMVGHYVTVYYKEAYKNEKEPGQVYTIVDETTVVEVKEDITTPKDYKAAFGKSYQMKKDTESSNKVVLFDKEYRHNNVVGTVPDSDDDTAYAAGNTAPAGTYFIADNAVVGYMAPVTKYASYIVDINKYEGSESVQIAGANGEKSIPNTAGDDQIVEYRGMIVGDYVTYVKVQDVYVLELVNPIQGTVTRTSKKEVDGVNRDVITLDGTDFVAFNGNTDDIGNKLSDDVSTIDYAQTYELYVTDDDQFVGFKAVGDIAVDDIVYALGVLTVTQKNDYGDTITEYKARCIDMEAKERLIVIGKDLPVDGLVGSTGAGVTRGFYSVKAHTGRDEKKEEIQVLTPVTNTYDGKGGYFVSGASKGAEAGFTSNSYGFVKSDDGMLTYGKPFSKYIFVDGDLNSPFELDVQSVDSMKAYTNYDSMEMLLSRNENGVSNDVVVMVVYGVSASTVNSNDSIYITAQQLKEYEQTAEGYVYSGYTPVDGAPAQVTVKNKLAGNESSFYMIQNRTGDLPTLNPVGHNEKFGTTDYIAYRNVAIQGFAEGLTVVGFNVADENGTAGIKLPWNASASVVVVDTRTQPEQDSSKTGLITSINQLNDLVARDPSRVVIADVYEDTSGNKPIKSIYITKVLYGTPGLNTILTCSGIPTLSGAGAKMTVVNSVTGVAAGTDIEVDYDRVYGAKPNAIYSYAIDASGKATLVVAHQHACSHTNTNHGRVAAADWVPLSSVLEESGSTALKAGHYYLDEDITLPTATGTDGKKGNHILINGNATICLNGHTLNSGDGQQHIIYLNGAYTLDICDCSAAQSGKITGLTSSTASPTYSAMIVRGGSTVNLYGGTITGNNSPSTVYVANSGTGATSTFNMYGGKIFGNTILATTQGAVHVASGTFNMSGGEIGGNETAPNVAQVTGAGTYNNTGGTINGEHTVTVNNTDPNGTIISVTPASGLLGETVTVTVDPKPDYKLDSILVDGKPITGNTFVITGDHVVSAIFGEAPKHEHSCDHDHPTAATSTGWQNLTQNTFASLTGAYQLEAGGYYYLEENIILPAGVYLSVPGGDPVTICLNSKTLTGSSAGYAIKIVAANGELNICDCGTGGKVVQNRAGALSTTSATVIVTGSNSKFNLYAGTIEGGVVLDGNSLRASELIVHGGTVKATAGNDVIFMNNNKLATVRIKGGILVGAGNDPAEIVVGSVSKTRKAFMYDDTTGVSLTKETTYQLIWDDDTEEYDLTKKETTSTP